MWINSCKAYCVFCSLIFLIIISFGNLSFSVIEIVIGFSYRHDCPLDRMIPYYLIMAGMTGIILPFFWIILPVASRACVMQMEHYEIYLKQRSVTIEFLRFVIGITFAYLVWTIVGNIIVFHHNKSFQANVRNQTSVLWCHPKLFNFAFYSIFIQYAFFCVIIFFLCVIRFLDVRSPTKS